MTAPDPSIDVADYIQARYHTRDAGRAVRGLTSLQLIVLHSTEGARARGAARAVAGWFAGLAGAPPMASAHYVVDGGEVIQCVSLQDIAWAAPGANTAGVHVELVGYARWHATEWLAGAEFGRAARLVSQVSAVCAIPPVYVDPDGIRRGERGITTHAAVSQAYCAIGGHWDPGPGFPMIEFLAAVGAAGEDS